MEASDQDRGLNLSRVGAPVFGPAVRVETDLERCVAAVREAAQRLSTLDGPAGHDAERGG